MFIGHFGLGLGAKKIVPNVSLGVLFIATQFLDLLWPILLLTGIEKVEITDRPFYPLEFVNFPISHSLIMTFVWAILVGLLYWIIKKDSKGSLILVLLVLSHWLLDFIVHISDLPILINNTSKVGLGLWRSVTGTALIEGILFFVGAYIYEVNSKSLNSKGKYFFPLLILILTIIHVTSLLGPPPPNTMAIAIAAQLQWVFIYLAFKMDSNRKFQTK